MFRFVERERASYPVRILCRVLGVSPSGFYAWRARPPSGRALADAQLTVTIRQIHADSRGCSGAPRVHAELHQAHGLRCGRKRVERLMRQAQLQGVCRGQHGRPRTTRREPSHAVTADLIHRHFRASGPDQLWVADITYLPTWQGLLYLDAFSRKVVGWSMANHLRTELVLGALDMALWNRRPHPA